MSDQEEQQNVSSDEEQIDEPATVEFKADAVPPVSPSKAKASSAATPSNTPVVSMYSKVPQQTTATKRSFEGEPTPKDVAQMLSSLNIGEAAAKKVPGKAGAGKKKGDPEDEPEDDEDEEDEDEDEEEEGDEDEEEEYIATPEQVEAALPLLRENHQKIETLKTEYQKARRKLELEFQEKREVFYKERNAIIRGDGEDGPALPGFWLDAMQRNMLLSQFIEEWDQPALMFLDDISVHELTGEEEFGFELTFRFAKNPFFTNETLSKKLVVSNLYAPDYVMPELEQSIGTEINWIADQNLTVRVEVKQVKRASRGKGKKGGVQEVRQEVPQDSFFGFFKSRDEKTEEELEQMPEEDQEKYHQEWETDFAIGSSIRSKLIPDATLWYTGEASDSEYGYDDEEGEEDEEDEGEFDELDEEDEEDEDEEEEKPAKGKAGKKGGKGSKPLSGQAAGGKEGEQPECKQQ